VTLNRDICERARTVFMLSGDGLRVEAKELSGAEVRASIVAKKSGNSDGAKGCRKVDE
jgi:hypothetical protein